MILKFSFVFANTTSCLSNRSLSIGYGILGIDLNILLFLGIKNACDWFVKNYDIARVSSRTDTLTNSETQQTNGVTNSKTQATNGVINGTNGASAH